LGGLINNKMVKLQKTKGRYWITILINKIKAGRYKKADSFSVDFNKQGQLVITTLFINRHIYMCIHLNL